MSHAAYHMEALRRQRLIDRASALRKQRENQVTTCFLPCGGPELLLSFQSVPAQEEVRGEARDAVTQTEQQPVGSRASSSAVSSSKCRSDSRKSSKSGSCKQGDWTSSLSGERRSQSATSRRSSCEETGSSVVTDMSSRKEACGSSYSARSSRLPSRLPSRHPHPSGEQSSRSGLQEEGSAGSRKRQRTPSHQSSPEIGAPRDGPNSVRATSRPASQTSNSSRRKRKNSGSVGSPSSPSHSTPPQEE